MAMHQQPLSKHLRIDDGSVTAELALALPAVAMVLAITLGAFALQIERMKLVDVSATAARAISRGEPEASVQEIVKQQLPGSAESLQFELLTEAEVVCVRLSKAIALPALGQELFELSETQCARKQGL